MNTCFPALLSAYLVFAASTGSAQPLDTVQIRKQLGEAEQFLEDHQAKPAMEILEPIVTQFQEQAQPPLPAYYDALKHYITALYQSDKYEEASKASENLVGIAKQISPANPTRLAEAWITYGLYSSNRRRFETAAEALRTADQLIAQHQLEQSPVYGYYKYTRQLYHYRKGEFDQSIAEAKEGVAWYRVFGDTSDARFSGLFKSMGVSHLIKGEYAEGVENTRKSIELNEKFRGKGHPGSIDQYGNLGIYYKQRGEYKKALEFYHSAAKIAKKNYGEKNDYLAACYNNIGGVYNRLGDYYRAITYLRQSEEIDKALQGKDYDGLTYAYTSYGIAYRHLQQYEKALNYLFEALRIKRLHYGEQHPFIAKTYSTIASVYLEMGAYEEAMKNQKIAIGIRTRQFGPGFVRLTFDYNQMGTIHRQLGQYEQAIANYEKSNQILRENIEGGHEFFAANYLQAGSIQAALNEFGQAFINFEKAFQNLNYSPHEHNLEKVNSYPGLLYTLEATGNAYYKKYTLEKNQKDLINAFQHCKKGLDVFQFLRRSIREEESRAFWADKEFSIFEQALHYCFELFQLTDSIRYQEEALVVMELSKSFNLLGALRGNQAADFAGMPEELLEEEREIKAALRTLQQAKLDLFENKDVDEEQLHKLDEQTFEARARYNRLLARIEENHPAYFRLKYSGHLIGLNGIRAGLIGDNGLLVEYFLGDSALYALAIGKKQCLFTKTPLTGSLDELVNQYRAELQKGNDSDSDIAGLGDRLYQLLLAKQLEPFGKKANRLIVVPDGILGLLPFEALERNDAKTPGQIRSASPLIYHYAISYAYSATLLQEQQNLSRQPAGRLFAGFAADYEQFQLPQGQEESESPMADLTRSGLLPLPNAKKEVDVIADLLGGDRFTGPDATEGRFKQLAPGYKVIHLSMHSLFDDALPLQSGLVFTPAQDSLEDGFLTAAELYNMQLNAELAVLSACNTGYGKIQRGEGIISLSRALAYTGVPATVMSLWKVPDRATSEIMAAFYRRLRAGLPKDEALRQAKLDYLNNVVEPDEQHPLFWAGFIPAGDMRPVGFPRQKWWRWVGVGVLALALAFWFFKMKRKKV